MTMKWPFLVIGLCLGGSLAGLAIVTRETSGPADPESLWKAQIQIVDWALDERNLSVAVGAWHDAYGTALTSRSWESMIAVGEAFVRIGQATGTPNAAMPTARQAYLTALSRARRDRSVDGMLRTADAFAALGDRAVVQQCIVVAEQFAARDESARRRVREYRARTEEYQAAAF
jgi:hypothetical protein